MAEANSQHLHLKRMNTLLEYLVETIITSSNSALKQTEEKFMDHMDHQRLVSHLKLKFQQPNFAISMDAQVQLWTK